MLSHSFWKNAKYYYTSKTMWKKRASNLPILVDVVVTSMASWPPPSTTYEYGTSNEIESIWSGRYLINDRSVFRSLVLPICATGVAQREWGFFLTFLVLSCAIHDSRQMSIRWNTQCRLALRIRDKKVSSIVFYHIHILTIIFSQPYRNGEFHQAVKNPQM